MFSFVIKYWMQILFSLLITLISHIYHHIYKYIKKIKSLEKQSCLNLKMHILDKYERINTKGYMTIKEKEEIYELYDIYKKLDCESVVDDLIQSLENIKIKKESN